MFCRVEPVELSFATALTAFADCFIIEKSVSRVAPVRAFFLVSRARHMSVACLPGEWDDVGVRPR